MPIRKQKAKVHMVSLLMPDGKPFGLPKWFSELKDAVKFMVEQEKTCSLFEPCDDHKYHDLDGYLCQFVTPAGYRYELHADVEEGV